VTKGNVTVTDGGSAGTGPKAHAARGHLRAAGVIDLITAAVAEHHGAVILHYDADFEHIAAVTGQPQVWIAPHGSIS
jgi:predicted nuclease of predicted toxin-antitoxin system